MTWKAREWNSGRRRFYRQCIPLRRSSPALRRGGFQILYAAGETLAFMREAPEERLIVGARRAADGLEALPVRHGGLPDGLVLQEVISSAETGVEQGMVPLTNPPGAGMEGWRRTGPGF